MGPLNLAVLSDLHVGAEARSKDLSPVESSKAIEDDYRDRFKRFIAENSLTADFLVCPGDVSNRAEPDEFQLASEVLVEAANALNVPEDRIIFVPGNHDVHWGMMNVYNHDRAGMGRALRYHALASGPHLFSRILSRSASSLVQPPYLALWEYPDLLAVGLNTSWHDSADVAVHAGLVSDDTIAELERVLTSVDMSPNRLRLFLLHHHPIQYSDPVSDSPDFSTLTNAGNLLALLRRKGFDFVIHGHKHKPNFETHIVNASSPLAVLGSGSFSALLDTRWAGLVSNQFHMVRLEERGGDNNCVCGYVESWAYHHTEGWGPSDTRCGIQHRVPFGSYFLPEPLKEMLRPRIEEAFRTRTWVDWSELVATEQRLRYLPPSSAQAVVDALAVELSFRRHGDFPNDVILLKR